MSVQCATLCRTLQLPFASWTLSTSCLPFPPAFLVDEITAHTCEDARFDQHHLLFYLSCYPFLAGQDRSKCTPDAPRRRPLNKSRIQPSRLLPLVLCTLLTFQHALHPTARTTMHLLSVVTCSAHERIQHPQDTTVCRLLFPPWKFRTTETKTAPPQDFCSL